LLFFLLCSACSNEAVITEKKVNNFLKKWEHAVRTSNTDERLSLLSSDIRITFSYPENEYKTIEVPINLFKKAIARTSDIEKYEYLRENQSINISPNKKEAIVTAIIYEKVVKNGISSNTKTSEEMVVALANKELKVIRLNGVIWKK
jgi:hypothetical protein